MRVRIPPGVPFDSRSIFQRAASVPSCRFHSAAAGLRGNRLRDLLTSHTDCKSSLRHEVERNTFLTGFDLRNSGLRRANALSEIALGEFMPFTSRTNSIPQCNPHINDHRLRVRPPEKLLYGTDLEFGFLKLRFPLVAQCHCFILITHRESKPVIDGEPLAAKAKDLDWRLLCLLLEGLDDQQGIFIQAVNDSPRFPIIRHAQFVATPPTPSITRCSPNWRPATRPACIPSEQAAIATSSFAPKV